MQVGFSSFSQKNLALLPEPDTTLHQTWPLLFHSVFFFFFFFFSLPVLLPSEIPKLPTDPPVRGFPTVWKLLLLHHSLPRTGLHSKLLLSLSLSFIFYPTSFQREWAASPRVQKLFCGSYSAFK